MWFSSWLRTWKRSAPTVRRRTQTSPRQRARFRPRLEALEDRTLPSVVNLIINPATNPSGAVNELIADINAANRAGGTNTLNLYAGGVYDLTAVNNSTNGANGLPVITKGDKLTIIGNGDTIERSTAAGTPDFRLFDNKGSLTLEDVTLQNGLAFGSGAAADGGAIYNQGMLTLINTIVQNNTAQGTDGAAGEVGKQFSNKKADGKAGGDAAGGGIWSSGSVTLQGGTILQGNQALGGNGGAAGHNPYPGEGGSGGSGFGGGFYEAGGSVNASNVTISGNTAAGGAGGRGFKSADGYSSVGGGGSGGGMYVAGGTLAMGDPLGQSFVTVEYNRALGGAGGGLQGDWGSPGGEGSGGGIAVADGTVTPTYLVTLTYVQLLSNIAEGGQGGSSSSGGPFGGSGLGGGLYVVKGTVKLTNDTVTGNQAIGGPGGDGNFPTTYHDGPVGGGGIYTGAQGSEGGVAMVYLDSFTVTNTTDNHDWSDDKEWEDNIDGSYTSI